MSNKFTKRARRNAVITLFIAVFTVLFMLFVTPVHAAEPPKKGQLSFAEAVAICREAFWGDQDKAKAALNAVKDPNERRAIALMCITYGIGAQDLQDAAERAAEAEKRT